MCRRANLVLLRIPASDEVDAVSDRQGIRTADGHDPLRKVSENFVYPLSCLRRDRLLRFRDNLLEARIAAQVIPARIEF